MKVRSFSHGLVIALAVQIGAGLALWGHSSADGAIAGRYSVRYALVLALHAVLTLLLIGAVGRAGALERWLAGRSQRWIGGLGMAGLIGLTGLWLLPVEPLIKQYGSLAVVLVLTIAAWPSAGMVRLPRWIGWGVAAGAVLLLSVLLLTALTRFPFSPDEAHWADYASTALRGGVYARTWLMEPTPITPGLGWSVAAYGWALDRIAFDIRTGRVWTFAAYLLTVIGIGWLTGLLYGRAAGWLSAAFALGSAVLFPVADYRPHHQIGAAVVGVVGLAIVSGRTTGTRRGLGHGGVGLLAVQSMQLHAVGIALAAAIALRYGLSGGWRLVRHRRWDADALAVGGGLLIGSALFYLTNLAPVGGLTPYLDSLIGERTQRQAVLFFLTWPSVFEGAIVALAVLLTIARWHAADRLYLSFVIPLLLALAVLDTQGYRLPAAVLFLVPVGALLIGGGDRLTAYVPIRVLLPLSAILLVLLLRGLTTAYWPGIGAVLAGQPPRYLYAELRDSLRPLVDPADRVVASHLLIWTLPEQPVLVSPAAEVTAQRRWGLSDPAAVWQRVDPTLIIDSPAQTTFSPALRAYMTERGFIPCHTLTVQDVTFTLYRIGCG